MLFGDEHEFARHYSGSIWSLFEIEAKKVDAIHRCLRIAHVSGKVGFELEMQEHKLACTSVAKCSVQSMRSIQDVATSQREHETWHV